MRESVKRMPFGRLILFSFGCSTIFLVLCQVLHHLFFLESVLQNRSIINDRSKFSSKCIIDLHQKMIVFPLAV